MRVKSYCARHNLTRARELYFSHLAEGCVFTQRGKHALPQRNLAVRSTPICERKHRDELFPIDVRLTSTSLGWALAWQGVDARASSRFCRERWNGHPVKGLMAGAIRLSYLLSKSRPYASPLVSFRSSA